MARGIRRVWEPLQTSLLRFLDISTRVHHIPHYNAGVYVLWIYFFFIFYVCRVKKGPCRFHWFLYIYIIIRTNFLFFCKTYGRDVFVLPLYILLLLYARFYPNTWIKRIAYHVFLIIFSCCSIGILRNSNKHPRPWGCNAISNNSIAFLVSRSSVCVQINWPQ